MPTSRAKYFAQRRDILKSVSVMIERDILDALDQKLAAQHITRSEWIRAQIYKELEVELPMPNTIYAKCPKCNKEAHSKDEIDAKFGWRVVNGKTVPQSWCYDCRNQERKEAAGRN